ncbi:MAG: hypothetical protein C6W54_14215 [Bacillaceae bacterium]|nr:MAG: hypothetical protein C6W54_14215 [Bacillaceae bacterium]
METTKLIAVFPLRIPFAFVNSVEHAFLLQVRYQQFRFFRIGLRCGSILTEKYPEIRNVYFPRSGLEFILIGHKKEKGFRR